MKIDRIYVKKIFSEYVKNYDVEDPKIALKIAHTYRVADMCDDIARSIGLGSEDADLAWLTGMLHDIGRFEQCRLYDSFNDGETVDHAKLSCMLLFADDLLKGIDIAEYGWINIREFIEDASEDKLLHDAVYYHNVFRMPEDMDMRTRMFADILRDADKVDILRVNIDTPLEDIYNVTTYELRHAAVSDAVMEAFHCKSCVDKRLKKTPIDNVVGHLSLVFELVYPRSIELVKMQGYIFKHMNFESDNPYTAEQFRIIQAEMRSFLGV